MYVHESTAGRNFTRLSGRLRGLGLRKTKRIVAENDCAHDDLEAASYDGIIFNNTRVLPPQHLTVLEPGLHK